MSYGRSLSYVSVALLSLITCEHRVGEPHYAILADEEFIEGVLIRTVMETAITSPESACGTGDPKNEFTTKDGQAGGPCCSHARQLNCSTETDSFPYALSIVRPKIDNLTYQTRHP
ncbi:hypothetical protein H4582DRAFT_2003859 [Lactarius indigo]|nr:hypothetical protein H4582DRAFT_2005947 [Lactarius indigo]KAI9431732.1 hypothetical protein H4582DRAFT_2003859 [Lactarius indigo]